MYMNELCVNHEMLDCLYYLCSYETQIPSKMFDQKTLIPVIFATDNF